MTQKTTAKIRVLLVSLFLSVVLILLGTWCYTGFLKTGNDAVGLENPNIKFGMSQGVLHKQLGKLIQVVSDRMAPSASAYYRETLYGYPCETVYSFDRRFGMTSLNEVAVTFDGLTEPEREQLFETLQKDLKSFYQTRADYYDGEASTDGTEKSISFGTDNGAVGVTVSLRATGDQLTLDLFNLE